MPHTMTTAMQNQTLAAQLMPILFAEIDTPAGNIQVWSGIGNLSWNGITWSGMGELGTISASSESTDLQAQGLVFTLGGFDAGLINKAIDSMRRFYPAKAWLGCLDGNFSVVADPYQFHNGLVDSASMTSDGKTASISVSSETRLIAMSQARERRYTDQDQRIECPQDGGFKFVDFLQNLITAWGSTAVTPTSTPTATSQSDATRAALLRTGIFI